MEFPIGKKLFHLVVNTGTWRCPTVDLELVQTTRNVNGTRHSVRKFQPGNGTTFLDFPLFLGIFQWDEPTKRVPFTAEPEIPEILTKWKAPREIMQTSLRSHAKDQRSALWALASIGHEQHFFFFLEKPYGTARPRKYYFPFILLLLKNYFTLLSIFFV